MIQCFRRLKHSICLCRRSSQQIYNVTLFFLFFMSLYSLLGVQFFGELTHHCVRNTTDPKFVFFLLLHTAKTLLKSSLTDRPMMKKVDHNLLSIVISSGITINSLAIPDTFCSPDPGSGYQCPAGMKCMKLNLSKYIMGFNGFEEFGKAYKLFLLVIPLLRIFIEYSIIL